MSLQSTQRQAQNGKSDSLGPDNNTGRGRGPRKKSRSRSSSLKVEVLRKYIWASVRPQPISKTKIEVGALVNSCYRLALWRVLDHQPVLYAFHEDCVLRLVDRALQDETSWFNGNLYYVKAIAELLELCWNVPNTDPRPKGQCKSPRAALSALMSAVQEDETGPFGVKDALREREQHDLALILHALKAQFLQAEADCGVALAYDTQLC